MVRLGAIPLTFVLTSDVAGYLADAVDAPGVDGQRIDIGWDRPVSMREIARISGRLLGQQIRVRTIPAGLINAPGRWSADSTRWSRTWAR